MIGYIYHIICKPTQKHYIGITNNIKRRLKKHRTELTNNIHHSPKLQNAWNFYGKENFIYEFREVEVESYEKLGQIEIEEIKKYDSYNNGYNCTTGGVNPRDWHQKVKNEDIITYLCIEYLYGEGYGKTIEEIFGWSRGTASSAKRREGYVEATSIFEKMTDQEKSQRAKQDFIKYKVQEKFLERQLKQGGCEKAYKLSNEDFFFAFAAQQLGYGYSCTAHYIGIKSATVKDWFNGRSRKKQKEEFLQLSEEEKEKYLEKVKNSNIEELQNRKEKELRRKNGYV